MKVTLNKKGKVVAELWVSNDGALCIRAAGEVLTMNVQDSRRLAGAIVERSVESAAKGMRAGIRAEITRALGLGEDD